MQRFKIHIRVALIVALCFFSAVQGVEGYPSTFQHRGLWVVRDALLSVQSIKNTVEFAAENGFNHLMVQVRGRGDAFYRSEFEPEPEMLDLQFYDPLEYIIDLAHQHGIYVHAWFNVYVVWSSKEEPTSDKHVVNAHRSWLDGNKENQNYSELYALRGPLDEGLYLAPHHPEVTPYMLSVFREVLEKYEVDGLHLDYIRYKDSEYGKNDQALATYTGLTGENPKVFLSATSDISRGDPRFTRQLTNWSEYRRRTVTDLVKQTRELVDEVRPRTIISASVKPDLYAARNRYFQEWDVWIAAGYLDWAIPMNYSQSIREFAAKIEIIYDNIPRKYRNRILMGISTYNQPSMDALDKMRYSRMTQFPGICLFSYNSLIDTPKYVETLLEELKNNPSK